MSKVIGINESYKKNVILLAKANKKTNSISSAARSGGLLTKDVINKIDSSPIVLPEKVAPLSSPSEVKKELNESVNEKNTAPFMPSKGKAPLDFELKGAGILHLSLFSVI